MPRSSPSQRAESRLGDPRALVRLVRQAGGDDAGPRSLAARRQMVARFIRMLGEQVNGEAETTVAAPALVTDLPKRLRETLCHLLQGDGEKQIAQKLGLSPHTVHVYVKSLHKRFNVSSRSELLARFIQRGAIPSAPIQPQPR